MDEVSPSPFKIFCKNYPSEFNLDKTIAKDYFRQFGKLKRVVFKPKDRICTVEYFTKQCFLKALKNAGEYNGSLFEVSDDDGAEAKKKKHAKPSKPIWLDDNEVESELKAMSAVGANSSLFPVENVTLFKPLKQEKKKKLKVWDVEASVKKKPKAVENNTSFIRRSALTQEHLTLINVVLSQSHTSEDKLKVLDARDKLLRIKIKQDNATKSSATMGTCPDMCPEKERLMREIQHQISIYEQGSGKSYHRKAIKQYSRSSADQETPLPHELRPVSVLQMTMCYLMHNVLDLIDTPDVNVSEWYHFLWDRTRGIRKDITQQELCSQGSVELLEQCARFHIHCSARLVGEEPSVFDHKINTENLTKSLQTLKYMYHDLQLKNEICPNEPEFRAYVILLNMNDGNFMWEVQQLRQDIQKSQEVKFALQVYSALDKNNYVKFFKLVKSTTYLNACILMRYFVQVRTTALKFLLKCYSPRATKILFPLNEFSNMLCFDDVESAIDFVEIHGLPLNEERSHFILDKSTFALPELPYQLGRSLNIVESKRIYSVGRVVCGKNLPPRTFDNHDPQDSFDPKGYLVSKDFLEETDLEQASKQLIEELTNVNNDDVCSANEDLSVEEEDYHPSPFKINEPITSSPKPSSTFLGANKEGSGIFQQPFLGNFTTTSIFGNKVQDVPVSSFRPLNESSVTEKNEEKQKQKNIFTFSQDSSLTSDEPKMFSDSSSQQPPQETTGNKLRKGGFSFNLVQSDKPREPSEKSISSVNIPPVTNLETSSSFIQKHFFKQNEEKTNLQLNQESNFKGEDKKNLSIVENDDKEIDDAKEKLTNKKTIEEKHEKLLEVKKLKQKKNVGKLKKIETKRLELVLNKEIDNAVKQIVNAVVTEVTNKLRDDKIVLFKKKLQNRNTLKVISRWRQFISNKRKRKAMDCTPVWIDTNTCIKFANELRIPSKDMTLSLMKRYKYGKPVEIEIEDDEEISKINLFELTYPTIKNRCYNLTGTIQKSVYWKVMISIPGENEIPSSQRIEDTLERAFHWENENHVVKHVKLNSFETVTYCVEKQKGLDIQESDSNGIIFIANNFNTILQRRIFEHLKSFGVFTKVPIVIVLKEYDENECKLKALQDAKILSDYVILIDHLSPHALLNSIEEGLVFLAGKIENCPPLELDTFISFMKRHLCSEIWKKANSFAKWNSQYKSCLKEPNVVINLYNEALGKLTKIIMDKSSKEFANFPQVFKEYLRSEIPDYLPCNYQYFPSFWRSEFYMYNLEKMLKKLSLPKWKEKWPPNSEFELEVDVAKYCTAAFKNPETTFYKIMGLLLRDVDPNVNFEDINSILWTSVIELLGQEKLNELDLGFKGTDFENTSIFNQYVVVYNKDVIEKYSKSDWMYIGNPLIDRRIKQLFREDKKKGEEKKTVEENKTVPVSLEDINRTIEEVTTMLKKESDHTKLQKEISDLNSSLKDLEDSMSIHKKINADMGEMLRKSILDS